MELLARQVRPGGHQERLEERRGHQEEADNRGKDTAGSRDILCGVGECVVHSHLSETNGSYA